MYRLGPKGAKGKEMGTNQPRARPAAAAGKRCGRPGSEHPPKLYLHNASTFSPGETCGAIPSRPLRRRSWCTPLGLGPVQQRGGWARSRHSRRLPVVALRRGPCSPAAHLGPTGRAGLRGAPDLRVQASVPQVREREQAAPLRPTPRSRGRSRAEGAPASLQDVRLADRLPDPPAAAAAIGIPGTLPRHLAGASVPCAPPPRDRTSPERFPKQTLRCKRAHTLAHTMPRAASTPARPLSVSVRPGRSSPSPSSGEGGSLPRTPGNGEERGSREGPVGSGRTAGPGSAAKGRAALDGRRWESSRIRRRVGSRSRPPKRAGSGGGTRRSAARLCGWIPLSRPLALLRHHLPHPGRAAGSEPPGPRPRSLPLLDPSSSLSSSPSHVRAGSGFCLDFL